MPPNGVIGPSGGARMAMTLSTEIEDEDEQHGARHGETKKSGPWHIVRERPRDGDRLDDHRAHRKGRPCHLREERAHHHLEREREGGGAEQERQRASAPQRSSSEAPRNHRPSSVVTKCQKSLGLWTSGAVSNRHT